MAFQQVIDLRSDTVTKPTEAMREAMRAAIVGDDVYGDDPTINALEDKAAGIMGMEDALFVPSGTFGNQLALFTHCERGQEVILGDDCHIVQHEAGAPPVIAGVMLRTIDFEGGIPDAGLIKKRIRIHEDMHEPKTGLICLENALGNGRVVSLDKMREVWNAAGEYGVPVHLDGARIFNAALALGVLPSEIARFTSSVMFCLSKGLCAPVGSVLAGSAAFIDKARRKRKIMGGAMRQAGVLAAPGLIALEIMTKRLDEDHNNAKLLGRLLAEIPGVSVALENIDINMVFFNINEKFKSDSFAPKLQKLGVLINGSGDHCFRMVTHNGISEDDVRRAASAVAGVLSEDSEDINGYNELSNAE